MRKYILRNADVRRNCLMEIQALPLDKFEIVIQEVRRSNHANALYWVWMKVIGDVKGFTPDDMHEAFKRHFLGEDEKTDIFGHIRMEARSSAKLKKGEFSVYMSKVEAYAHMQNITLPTGGYYGYELQASETTR